MFGGIPGLGDEDRFGFPADVCPDILPNLVEHNNLTADILHRVPGLYEKLRHRQTKYGSTLARCIKAAVDIPICDDMAGDVSLFAADEECYDAFSELFDVVIQRLTKELPEGTVLSSVPPQRTIDAHSFSGRGLNAARIDASGKYVLSCQVRAIRNIKGFRFPPAMTSDDRTQVEQLVARAMRSLHPGLRGVYLPLTGSKSYNARQGGMDLFEARSLKAAGLYFSEPTSQAQLASGVGRSWPHGRGIFASSDRNLAVQVNNRDHVNIVSVQRGDDLQTAYRELQKGMEVIHEVLRRARPLTGENQLSAWAKNERLGYLTTSPMNVGAGFQASIVIKLPKLMSLKATSQSQLTSAWSKWAFEKGVKVEELKTDEGEFVPGVYVLTTMRSFNLTNVDIINTLIEVGTRLVTAEVSLEKGLEIDGLFLHSPEAKPSQIVSQASPEEELRLQMISCLLKAMQNGNLDRALQQQQEKNKEQTKDAMATLLLQATDDGSLEKTIQDINQRKQEEVYLQTRTLLLQAVDNGQLEKALQQIQEKKKDDVQAKTSALLLQAVDSGILEKTLQDFRRSKTDEMRLQISEVLLKASGDGSLDEALAELAKSRQDVAVKDTPRFDLELIRGKTQEMLIKAAITGDLERALQQVQQEDAAPAPLPARPFSQEDAATTRPVSRVSAAASSIDDIVAQDLVGGLIEKELAQVREEAIKTLEEDPQEAEHEVPALLRRQTIDGSLFSVDFVPEPEALDDGDIDSLRGRLKDCLIEKVNEGTLEEVFASLTKGIEDESSQRFFRELSHQITSPKLLIARTVDFGAGCDETIDLDLELESETMDDLRSRLRVSLLEKVSEGAIDHVLSALSTVPDEQAKVIMRGLSHSVTSPQLLTLKTLDAAAFLDDAETVDVDLVPESDSLDDLRGRLRDCLFQKVTEGTIEDALQQVLEPVGGSLEGVPEVKVNITGHPNLAKVEDSEDALRSRLQAQMLAALENGQLEKALQATFAGDDQKKPLVADLDLLRKRVADSLEAALADGSLDAALKQVIPVEPPKPTPPQAPPAKSKDPRSKAKGAILKGLKTGELEKAVTKMEKDMAAAEAQAQKEAVSEAPVLTQGAEPPATFEFTEVKDLAPLISEVPSAPKVNSISKICPSALVLSVVTAKSRRAGELTIMILEAEKQLRERELLCQDLQADILRTKSDLAHLELDVKWHRSALALAEDRRQILQDGHRKLQDELLSTIKQLRLADLDVRHGGPSANSARSELSTAGTMGPGSQNLGSTSGSLGGTYVPLQTPRGMRLQPIPSSGTTLSSGVA